MIQPQLKSYIEQQILPLYDHFDAAHQRNHAEEVIERSMALARHYDADENMVYAIAAYHDTGLCKGRDIHHLASGRIQASTVSTALTAASITPVCPTMSQLAKLQTISA